jgi:hypothetical protein
VCISAGLDHQQLLALQAGLQHLADPFKQLLEQYQQYGEDEAEAHRQTQTVSRRQRPGPSKSGCRANSVGESREPLRSKPGTLRVALQQQH